MSKQHPKHLFETNGNWASLPIILQGIFEDKTCIAFKALNATNGKPISWGFSDKTTKDFIKLLERKHSEQEDC